MIYTLDFAIEANTSKRGRITDNLYVVKGLVYKIEFKFPPGSAGLAHVCLNQGKSQIWPSTPGDYFESDDETISFTDPFQVTSDPAQFEAYGYNDDTVNSHTIYIRLGLVDKLEYQAMFLPGMLAKFMKEEIIDLMGPKEPEPAKFELILPFRTKD